MSLGPFRQDTLNARVAGINLEITPLSVSSGYMVAEKLLTQARKTVGVPDSRYQDLPKHLYDLDGTHHARER